MSTNLTRSNELVTNELFSGRVRAAVIQMAIQIYGEAATVPEHSVRFALAQRVIFDPDAYSRVFTYIVSDNSTISGSVGDQSTINDADINFVVSTIWTLVATKVVVS